MPGFMRRHSIGSLHREGRILVGHCGRQVGLAASHGGAVHLWYHALRHEDPRKILSWKIRHLGKSSDFWSLLRRIIHVRT